MSGCGTSLDGRAIFEVYEDGTNVNDYNYWVKNYISAQRLVALGRATPEQGDWSGTTFYMKESDSTDLVRVWLWCSETLAGESVCGWEVGHHTPYSVGGEDLTFTFDPYEGLERYTFTIVPRDSYDDPIPPSWNGKFIMDTDCPTRGRQHPADLWAWVDANSIDVNISADVLVTPYGEDSGVTDPIASRVIAFEPVKEVRA